MKMYPIHKNLSTAFVNLTALVQYLRSLQFVGSIHVELSSYEADIAFTKANLLLAREYDHIAGRSAHGDHALQRILIRAKDPCGRIHVFPAAEDKTKEHNVFIDESIATGARQMAAGRSEKRGRSIRRSNRVLKPLIPALFNEKRPEKEQRISATEWNELLDLTEELLRIVDESLTKTKINFHEAFQNACG